MKFRYLILLAFWMSGLSAAAVQKECRRPNFNEPVGFVVADDPAWGRLGNQLFVVSTVLAYGWDHGFKPIFPALNRLDNQLSYNRDRLFFRLNTEPFPFHIQRKIEYRGLSFQPLRPYKNTQNVSLQGQFVSWKFFHDYREDLLCLFEPSIEIKEDLLKKYAQLMDHTESVAVHVRTYSLEYYNMGYPFLGKNYYTLAFEQFSPDAVFVVFSDRINWCRVKFQEWFPERHFEFIEGNDHVEDLFLMASMKHQIISNSTYSWWGAYLNKSEGKKIYCPQQFFRDPTAIPVDDFYLPDWNIIPYDFTSEPYPDDIQAYDSPTADDLKRY